MSMPVPASRSTVRGAAEAGRTSATPASGITILGSRRRARSLSSDRAAPANWGSSSSSPMRRIPAATSPITPAQCGPRLSIATMNSHCRATGLRCRAVRSAARSTRSCRCSSGRRYRRTHGEMRATATAVSRVVAQASMSGWARRSRPSASSPAAGSASVRQSTIDPSDWSNTRRGCGRRATPPVADRADERRDDQGDHAADSPDPGPGARPALAGRHRRHPTPDGATADEAVPDGPSRDGAMLVGRCWSRRGPCCASTARSWSRRSRAAAVAACAR